MFSRYVRIRKTVALFSKMQGSAGIASQSHQNSHDKGTFVKLKTDQMGYAVDTI